MRNFNRMNDWMTALSMVSLLCNNKHCTDMLRGVALVVASLSPFRVCYLYLF